MSPTIRVWMESSNNLWSKQGIVCNYPKALWKSTLTRWEQDGKNNLIILVEIWILSAISVWKNGNNQSPEELRALGTCSTFTVCVNCEKWLENYFKCWTTVYIHIFRSFFFSVGLCVFTNEHSAFPYLRFKIDFWQISKVIFLPNYSALWYLSGLVFIRPFKEVRE